MRLFMLALFVGVVFTGCIGNVNSGERSVIECSSEVGQALLDSTDCSRISQLELEISNFEKRGKSLDFSIQAVSQNQLDKNEFLVKELNTGIDSYQDISFITIQESVNLLLTSVVQSDKVNYYHALNLFQNDLMNVSKSQDLIMINIGKSSFFEDEKSDVFCVVGAYDENTHNALLLEINGEEYTTFWVHYKNLFDMVMDKRNQLLSVSGWLKLKKLDKEFYSASR